MSTSRFILIFREEWLNSLSKGSAKVSKEMEIIVKGYIPEAQNVLCGKLFETEKTPLTVVSFEVIENNPDKLEKIGLYIQKIAGENKVKVAILNTTAMRFSAFSPVRTCDFALPKQDFEYAEKDIIKKLADVKSKQGLSFSFVLLKDERDLKVVAFNKKASGINLYSWQKYFGDLCRFWKGANLVFLWSFVREM